MIFSNMYLEKKTDFLHKQLHMKIKKEIASTTFGYCKISHIPILFPSTRNTRFHRLSVMSVSKKALYNILNN